MSRTTATFLTLLVSICTFAQTQTFHDYKAWTITGQNLSLSDYYGKKVMVVNTASECSWVYQFAALQDLYDTYKDSNFAIIGFPSDDYNQELGTDSAILEYCTAAYGVTFQMMSAIAVVSHDTADVYKWLQREDLNGVADAHVVWNFNKFLIDEAGHWVAHYTNLTEPDNQAIINWILSPSVLPPVGINNNVPEMGMRLVGDVAGNVSVSFNNTGNVKTVINLVSMSGQLLSKVHDDVLNDGEVIHIDTNRFGTGIYFLYVTHGHSSKVFRLAVMK